MWINQTATFTCATTNVAVSTLRFTGMPNAGHVTTTSGELKEGQPIITASFTVTADNNGTGNIRCVADIEGEEPQFTEAGAYALAQGTLKINCTSLYYIVPIGPPLPVRDLTAVQRPNQHSILIQWKPPYLFPGLSVSYKVYINGSLIQDNISTTQCIYNLMIHVYSIYEVTVKAFNSSIIGEAAHTTVHYEPGVYYDQIIIFSFEH